jgi:hypothetical protein
MPNANIGFSQMSKIIDLNIGYQIKSNNESNDLYGVFPQFNKSKFDSLSSFVASHQASSNDQSQVLVVRSCQLN